MARTTQRRLIAALVAPILGAAIIGGSVADAAPQCDSCPVTGPVPCYTCPPGAVYSEPATPVPNMPVPTDAPQPTEPMVNPVTESSIEPSLRSDFPDFGRSTGLATNFGGGGATSLAYAEGVTPGYIESAIIQNRVRVRYDNMQGANAATRGQFLYPTLGAFGGKGPPAASGPGLTDNSGDLDIEQISTYIELAFRDRFSVFIDVPIRWIGPIDFDGGGFTDGTQRGAGDISTGFRWGWIDCPDEHLTFQLRTTLPTGESLRAVGTGNTTIDLGLLYDQRIGSRTRFYAELNDWQTLDAVDITSSSIPPSLRSQDANILRGGLGFGFDLIRCGTRCKPRSVTLLTEVVGWTVLDGVTTSLATDNNNVNAGDVVDAVGDTIVNGKYGARFNLSKNSVYVGYGHNWTGDRWYSDLFRIEWQRVF